MGLGVLKTLIKSVFYRLAPVKDDRFVFTSLNGHYSDNPRYISQALHEADPGAEIIWLVSERYKDEVPSWAKVYDIDSYKAAWIRGTAKAVIDNVYCERGYTVFGDSKLEHIKGEVFLSLIHI